jgi:hypothetical protein
MTQLTGRGSRLVSGEWCLVGITTGTARDSKEAVKAGGCFLLPSWSPLNESAEQCRYRRAAKHLRKPRGMVCSAKVMQPLRLGGFACGFWFRELTQRREDAKGGFVCMNHSWLPRFRVGLPMSKRLKLTSG